MCTSITRESIAMHAVLALILSLNSTSNSPMFGRNTFTIENILQWNADITLTIFAFCSCCRCSIYVVAGHDMSTLRHLGDPM